MMKILLLYVVVSFALVFPVLAEHPIFPGAKIVVVKASPRLDLLESQYGGVATPSISAERVVTTYSLPASTRFTDVRRFYGAELQKSGYIEMAGAGSESAGYQMPDGAKIIKLSAMENPTKPTELLLSVVEIVNR